MIQSKNVTTATQTKHQLPCSVPPLWLLSVSRGSLLRHHCKRGHMIKGALQWFNIAPPKSLKNNGQNRLLVSCTHPIMQLNGIFLLDPPWQVKIFQTPRPLLYCNTRPSAKNVQSPNAKTRLLESCHCLTQSSPRATKDCFHRLRSQCYNPQIWVL